MSIFSGIMIFVLIWWMVFFCALPFRIEPAKAHAGNMPGAPQFPHIKGKMLVTTLIAAVIWTIAWLLIRSNLISFHDIAARMSV